jgi:lysophospholipase L1-like esterase
MKYLIVLFFALLFICCEETNVTPTPNNPTNPTTTFDDTLTYLALGDSYTIGESVPVDKRYPVQLADSLMPNETDDKEVRIIAQTGWRTDNLKNGIASATNLREEYDLVSLLIGVNNQFQGRSLEEYKVEFRELLEQAIDFAGDDKDRVFVVSIPDYAYTPFGNGNPNISQEIDDFNAANKAITDELEVQYFNITSISREGLSKPFLVANDGLHPSGEQYNRWVTLMLDDVREMLEN